MSSKMKNYRTFLFNGIIGGCGAVLCGFIVFMMMYRPAPMEAAAQCPVCETCETPIPSPTPSWSVIPTDPPPAHFHEGYPMLETLIDPPGYPYEHGICADKFWWRRGMEPVPAFRGPYWAEEIHLTTITSSIWIDVIGVRYNSEDEIWLLIQTGWALWIPYKHPNCPDFFCGELYYSVPAPPVIGG